MKPVFIFSILAFLTHEVWASDNFFKISSQGTSITIQTTTPHFIYKNAGIKILSNAFVFTDPQHDCAKINKNFCVFSASDQAPTTIHISGPTQAAEFILCLNVNGPTSCETYSISMSAVPTPALYIANGYGTGTNNVSRCMISNNSLDSCSTSGNDLDNPFGIAINAARTHFYVTNPYDNDISKCQLSGEGLLIDCKKQSFNFDHPMGIELSSNYAYIANYNTNTISKCDLDFNGDFTGCTTSGSNLSGPVGVTFNNTQDKFYITNYLTNQITQCSLSVAGDLVSCSLAGSNINTPTSIRFNHNNTLAYITNYGANTLTQCAVNKIDGSLNDCATENVNFSAPQSVALNANDSIAYISNAGNNHISICQIINTHITNCVDSSTTFNGPTGLTLIE